MREGHAAISISVEDGINLVITASNYDRHFVFLKLSRGDALKLIKMIERALIDAKKPLDLGGNQSSSTNYGTILYGESISVILARNSNESKFRIMVSDRHTINVIHLVLDEGKTLNFLSILQRALSSMKKARRRQGGVL